MILMDGQLQGACSFRLCIWFDLWVFNTMKSFCFFPSNASMASARSFNMFQSMLQLGLIDKIKSRKGRCCSGRKSKLVEDRYIVLCTVTFIQKTKQNTKKQRNKNQKQNQTQTEHKHTKTKANKPKNNTHHRAVT